MATAENLNINGSGGNSDEELLSQFQQIWPQIPTGYGVIRYTNTVIIYGGIYNKYSPSDGSVAFQATDGSLRICRYINGAASINNFPTAYDMNQLISPVSQTANAALYGLSNGRLCMDWNDDSRELWFYIDGTYVGKLDSIFSGK